MRENSNFICHESTLNFKSTSFQGIVKECSVIVH